MQLRVTIRIKDNLVLPVDYNYILQSMIYKALGNNQEYSSLMHDQGFGNSGRSYKFFSFSRVEGQCFISDNKLVFKDSISFEVRSIIPQFIILIYKYFQEEGCTFGRKRYRDVELKLEDRTIEQTDLVANMVSPVCAFSTDFDTKHTRYYNPGEEEFYTRINNSFKSKYEALYGIVPESDIRISKELVIREDKMLTKYKGFLIEAWFGRYRIAGERKYLDFLYQTGIGSKTAQGFGLFEKEE